MHSPLRHLATALLSLLIAAPAIAQNAAPAAPDADWEQVAGEMIQRPEFEALPLQVRSVRGQAFGGSPVEMQFQAGQCVLTLRTRGNPAASLLLAQAAPEDRTLWMQTVIAHEIAHCWRWQEDPPALQQLAALTSGPDHGTRQGEQAIRQLRHEESFADAAALAWVRRVAPQRLGAVLGAFDRLRGNSKFSSGGHDTRGVLGLIREQGIPEGAPVFAAASALVARMCE